MISKCNTCTDFRINYPKEPLRPTPISNVPWQLVGSDLFTLNNEDYLVIVDYYSKFFQLAILKTPEAKLSSSLHIKSAFDRHGIRYEVRSDNGPQYTSRDFKDFARKWSFKHTSSSPYNPQGNGLAEKLSRL